MIFNVDERIAWIMRGYSGSLLIFLLVFLWFRNPIVRGATDAGDVLMLEKFRKGLSNPELLKWPAGDDDPCGNKWAKIYCSGSRVAQIQVQNVGLSGALPEDFNKLTELVNLGLQRNNFSGKLPSFSGLSKLQYAYLDENQFDAIPADFFDGLTSLEVLSLSMNPLNVSGWMLPKALGDSEQLTNLSLIGCNLVGHLPDFLGGLQSLTVLQMSYNMLSGEIPASYGGLPLQILWLNNQKGSQLSGSLDVISSMSFLHEAWLHGNSFTGSIPSSIGQLTFLQRLWINDNQLVGIIPENLTSLKQLQSLRLDNNFLVGPIPKNSIANFSYSHNPTCQVTTGLPCAPEVTALLDFLGRVNWPLILSKSWSGNDPCNDWLGVSCSAATVSTINLPNFNLNGTISPSLVKLSSLVNINLQGNNLNGTIPAELTNLQSLKLLNLSSNNLEPPVPNFSKSVKFFVDDNPQIQHPGTPAAPDIPRTPTAPDIPQPPRSGDSPGDVPFAPSGNGSSGSKKLRPLVIAIPIIICTLIISLVGLVAYFLLKKKESHLAEPSFVVHPKNSSDCNLVKVSVCDNNSYLSTSISDFQNSNCSCTSKSLIESGNLVISVQVLRSATQNFSSDNELGRGGFGTVYKGKLPDKSLIAVKRMEFNSISSQCLDEFHAEISVLSKVRHRNLVSLMGYSVEGNEKLLVYEYMPQGSLNRHLFRWKELGLSNLSWKKRLNIALDVARAMEYLHSLAQNQGYIHRDLKSSNILLDDNFHAKVSDFGLVKLAPDGNYSMATRLAGTFGYLAPEYAVTGKITTKADVFSFGVVLLELVTGLMVIDENRPDDKQYLVSWFYNNKWDRETLKYAIDNQIDTSNEETFESICKVVELLGHCTAKEPSQRPEMGYAVSVLSSMVQKWKPGYHDPDDNFGIEFGQPLLQMVKGWQEADPENSFSINADDSIGSIPDRPAGFADSFTSQDGW